LRPRFAKVYRHRVAGSTRRRRGGSARWLVAATIALAAGAGCTTIDPGADFVVPVVTFNADYFYCHVEPQVIFALSCGPGDPTKGDPPNGCHFNPSAVSGMALIDHPAVDCGGGDHPVDTSQTGTGGPAQGNLEAVSLEMSVQWQTAPLFVRPSGNDHPRAVFSPNDPNVRALLMTWASQ
jgi:hypothetical protein